MSLKNFSFYELEYEINEFKKRSSDHNKFATILLERYDDLTTKRNGGQIVISKTASSCSISQQKARILLEELQRLIGGYINVR